VATIAIKKEFTCQVIRSTDRWYFRERQHGPAWTCNDVCIQKKLQKML